MGPRGRPRLPHYIRTQHVDRDLGLGSPHQTRSLQSLHPGRLGSRTVSKQCSVLCELPSVWQLRYHSPSRPQHHLPGTHITRGRVHSDPARV